MEILRLEPIRQINDHSRGALGQKVYAGVDFFVAALTAKGNLINACGGG